MQEIKCNNLRFPKDESIVNCNKNNLKNILEMCPIPLSKQSNLFEENIVRKTTFMEHETNNKLATKITAKVTSNQLQTITKNDHQHQQHLKKSHSIQVQRYTCSNLTRQQLKAKANLMSARNQIKHQDLLTFVCLPYSMQDSQQSAALVSPQATKIQRKLRFHHQALPAEYLSHFEASQTKESKFNKDQKQGGTTSSKSKTIKNKTNNQRQHPAHENVKSWLQKIAEMQTNSKLSNLNIAPTITRNPKIFHQFTDLTKATKSLVIDDCEESSEINMANNRNQLVQSPQNTLTPTIASFNTNTVNSHIKNEKSTETHTHFNELPFMGEMTLDNYKPRRGRKPKKTDICHLIYKNYGTQVPNERILKQQLIQTNKIHSLIENNNNNKYYNIDNVKEEPLNLCLRDLALNQNFYSNSNFNFNTTIDNSLKKKKYQQIKRNVINSSNNSKDMDMNSTRKLSMTSIKEKDKFNNPIALYCQQLLECGITLPSVLKTIQKDNQLSLKIPIPSDLLNKTIQYHGKDNNCLNSDNIEINKNSMILPQRRKRSAIFLPSIKTNTLANGNNNIDTITNANDTSTVLTKASTNQVSICKFKFTGGPKPSLLEKKMLSMDAAGNYHYFHGTNDGKMKKSPTSTISLNTTKDTSSSAHFWCHQDLIDVNKTNTEKDSTISSKFVQDNEIIMENSQLIEGENGKISAKSLEMYSKKNEANFTRTKINLNSSQITTKSIAMNAGDSNGCRKESLRQVRRGSTQREKLEKTFKEQGFLIQTQQLQSAEGVTYCKFRQLKKFSRYLFRNWKDYLPEQLQQQHQHQQSLLQSQKQHYFQDNTTTKD